MFGRLLFIHYISDFDVGTRYDVSKFADYTKIGRVIKLDQDAGVLTDKLNRLYDWVDKW